MSFFDNLQTGDLLLFQDKTFFLTRLISWWTDSPWTHVAMVLRDPVYINPKLKGLYLWQSGLDKCKDAENNILKTGVEIVDLKKELEEHINVYKEIVYYRKFQGSIPDMEEKLKSIHIAVHDKSYDTNLLDFIETSCNIEFVKPYGNDILHLFRRDFQKTEKFYCSAFIAYLYTTLGLLPEKTKWTICEPGYFGDDSKFILLHGKMGKPIKIILS